MNFSSDDNDPTDPRYFKCLNYTFCQNNWTSSNLLCDRCSETESPSCSLDASEVTPSQSISTVAAKGKKRLFAEVTEVMDITEPATLWSNHGTKVLLPVKKGKLKGKEIVHFKCSYCRDKNFQGPSSTAFLEHLRKVHPYKCPELLPSVNKPPKDFFSKAKNMAPFNEDVFMGKLLKWIIKTDQPFSVVDNEDFEDLLNYLKKDFTLKARRTIMRRLDELYDQKRHEMKERMNGFKSKFSLTCDVWTSKNQLSFFGFTVHYIDDDWQMKQELLAFKYLQGEHDGKSLSVAFIEVLEDFGIADRLLAVTADNASNNSTMMVEMGQYYKEHYPHAGFSVEWNQIECMAHVLNLGAQEVLKNFKQPVDKETYEPGSDSADTMVTAVSRLSFLCRKIRLAPKLRRLMQKVCNEKDLEYLVPIIDVVTRWNSTYDMLLRAIEYKDILSDAFYRFKDRGLIKLVLDDDDWACVQKLIDVLKPLKEATLLASKNGESLMVTNMIPLYHFCTEMLKESLKNFDENDDIYVGIEAAIEKLNHYYDKISPVVGIALILDPTLKKDFLKNSLGWQDEWVDSVMEHFTSSFRFYSEKSQVSAASAPVEMGISSGLYAEFRKKAKLMNKGDSVIEEYVRYFNAPLAEESTNALAFWKANQYNFPVLSTMAKDYLTIQASSVASERAFSSGTDLVTADRCRLTGDTIEKTQFLKFVL